MLLLQAWISYENVHSLLHSFVHTSKQCVSTLLCFHVGIPLVLPGNVQCRHAGRDTTCNHLVDRAVHMGYWYGSRRNPAGKSRIFVASFYHILITIIHHKQFQLFQCKIVAYMIAVFFLNKIKCMYLI